MTVIYPIPGYPSVILAQNGEQVTIRPMESDDGDALLSFFQRIPEEDRAYLKEDVTSPWIIKEWTDHLDYSRVLPLLAIIGDRIVANATLHRRRPLVRKHVGEIRVVVDPEFRNQGIGRNLLRMLLEIAEFRQLEKVIIEIVADKEESARRTAEILGFTPATVLKGHIRDLDGSSHDLVVMELPNVTQALGTEWEAQLMALEGTYY